MAERQRVADHGHERKYWTQVPNLLDDSDLDPYARTLYTHYKRLAGPRETCEETVRETAERCRMSPASVLKARVALTAGEWITVEEIGTHGRGSIQRISLLDRWGENMARYAQPNGNGNVRVANNSTSNEEKRPGGERIVRDPDVSDGNVRVANELCHQPDILISAPLKNLEEPETKEPEEPGAPGGRARAGGQPCPKPVRKATRYDHVLALIRSVDVDVVVGGTPERNEREIDDSPNPDELIAEAYLALMHGQWNDPFVRKFGSLQAVVQNLGAYTLAKASGFAAPVAASPPGHPNGASHQDSSSARADMAAKFAHLGATA